MEKVKISLPVITIDLASSDGLQMLEEDLKLAIATSPRHSPRSMGSRLRALEIEWQTQEKHKTLTPTVFQLIVELLSTNARDSLKSGCEGDWYAYEICGELSGTHS